MRNRNQIRPLLAVIVLLLCLVILLLPGGIFETYLEEHNIHLYPTPTPTAEPSAEPTEEPAASPSGLPEPTQSVSDTPTPTEEPTPTSKSVSYQYQTDITDYMAAICTVYEQADILLVNEENPLPTGYIPPSLVELDSGDTLYGKSIELESTTASALKAMLLCMRADGITNTFVTSGYRDYNYQVSLFNYYIRQERSERFWLTEEKARERVLAYSASPGCSEHQTGLCIDFMTTSMTELNNSFESEPACTWLMNNAAYFGFVLRFPQDKTSITGHTYESWHYRFVGRERALEMKESGLCLEEYLAK